MESKPSSAKYIPPHRRNPPPTHDHSTKVEGTRKGSVQSVFQGSAIKPGARSSESYFQKTAINTARYTRHALKRMEEREIKEKRIQHTVRIGNVLKNDDSTTYINETTQAILAKDGAVITVLENKRNTRFDLLTVSKGRENALLEKAFYKNNSHAMCELGDLYLEGSLGKRDVVEAHKWFLKAANQGSSHAMILLAKLYQNGDLGNKDPVVAEEWMLKAAQQNNKYALAVLGQKYLSYYLLIRSNPDRNEIEEKEALAQAIHFLERSARKGSTRALWHLGKIYEEGYSKETDLRKAIEYYVKAAKQGSPSSLESLNALVAQGLMDTEIFEQILNEASSLVARTSSEMAVELGLKQIKGTLGKNTNRGFYILEQAAEKRNVHALSLLVKYYQKEIGGPPNLERAHYWQERLEKLYKQAAAQGNTEALWNLGCLYLESNLGKKDLETAEAYLIQAAKIGDPDLAYTLGMWYREGSLGDINLEKALYWLEKSIPSKSLKALEGDVRAALDIGDLYLNGDLGTKDYAQALHWFQIANSQKNIKALLGLAETYSALGMHEKTVEYYEDILSLQKNSPKAKPLKLAETLTSLGWYNCRYLGEYVKAKAYHEEALEIYTLLREPSDRANAFNNLGHVYIALGELEKAEQAYIAALNVYRTISQALCIDRAESLNGLGDVFRLQGQIEKASEQYQEALGLCESFNQESQAQVVESCKGLGKLSEDQGNFDKAKAFYEKALTISQALFGNEHPETARVVELLKILTE